MAAERLDEWIVIGPGGGGGQFLPTVSPHDSKIACVRCDMTGAYITKDGGESWRMFNFRTTVSWFHFDPVDASTIYAYAGGLFRSTDQGETWELVYPDPDKTTGITVGGDHAGWRWNTEGGSGRMSALAVDPADSKTLYAIIDNALMISEDFGGAWRDITFEGGLDGGMEAYIDPRSPADDRTIYIVENNRVSVREKGEWTHHPAAPGVRRFQDVSAGWPSEGGAPVIYAVARAAWRDGSLTGGILLSRDGGQSWQTHNEDFTDIMMEGADPPYFPTIATCETDPSVAYVSYRNVRFGTERWDYYFGTAKTSDTGESWDLAIKDTFYEASPNEKDAWMNDYFHPEWGEAPFGLGVAPTDPDVCFGTDYGRTMRTTDGLKTWEGVYSKPRGEGWATAGLDVTTCYGAHRDPHDLKRLFITYTDIGLWRSEDGGTTWLPASDGIKESGWRNTCYWLVFDPEVEGRAWSCWASNHDLPRPKMWRGAATVEHYRGGMAISDDAGKSWTISNEGMPQTAVTHILLDEKSPVDSRTLYAAGFGTGVWKSTDGGKAWALKREGLPGAEPFAWRLAMDSDGVIYLVIARRTERSEHGTEGDGGLYRSSDGAETWEQVKLPEGLNGPNGIHIDPRDPRRLYLACWGRGDYGRGATEGGIYLSTDRGESWRNIFDENQFVYDVTVDPRNPDTLYCSGFESSAWRSDDAGETWRRLGGFNFKWGHRVMPDPVFPDKIFVSTFGGSVWYGPADGDPEAPDDIATKHLGYSALGH